MIRNDRRVALERMDNVGIVVESLDAAISFFAALGLELEGRAMRARSARTIPCGAGQEPLVEISEDNLAMGPWTQR